MSNGRNAVRLIAAFVVASAGLSATAMAATPDELLDQAVKLFEQGKYEPAQEVLLTVDRDQLNKDRQQRRDELAGEVNRAINQSRKATDNLADAAKAFEAKELANAEKLYRTVVENAYATAEQKQQARQSLALINERRTLDRKLSGKASAPPATTRPTVPQVAASRPADEFSKARVERAAAQAKATIDAGDQAMAQGQYDLAEKRFQEALKLVPNHPAAVHGLDLVREHRAAEGQPNLIDEAEKRRRVRWERVERMYEQNEKQIREMANEHKYDDARRRLADTEQLLESGRQDAYPADRYTFLKRQVEAVGRYITADEADYQEDRAAETRKTIVEKDRERQSRVQKARNEQIAQLFDKAQQLNRDREYEKAADTLREVLAIDPTYEKAQWMIDSLETTKVIQDEKAARDRFNSQMQKALGDAEIAKTPEILGTNGDVMSFPDENLWKKAVARPRFGLERGGGEQEVNLATEKLLESYIPPITFEDNTTLQDAINNLKTLGKAAIGVDWPRLQAKGVDKTQAVTAFAIERKVRLETALEMLLEAVTATTQINLSYTVMDGIIWVSSADADNERLIEKKNYDITDLVTRPKPSMSGGMGMGGMGMGGMGMGGMGMGGMGMGGMGMGGMGMGGMGMGGMGGYGGGGYGGYGGGYGGGGYGGGGYGGGQYGGGQYGGGQGRGDDDDSQGRGGSEKDRVTKIKEAIEKKFAPGTWKGAEGAVEEKVIGSVDELRTVQGDVFLTIRHIRPVQRAVKAFLKDWMGDKVQVSVEARLISIQRNFLEQIGVDLDVILNNGNAGMDYALTQTGGTSPTTTIDPVTGAALLYPRRWSQLGFTPATPAFGQPLAQGAALAQPFGQPSLVPTGSPNGWFDQHTTSLPLVNNTMSLAQPRDTGVPGSLAASNTPAFTTFGSFLDNIQVDFLIKATQLDANSSVLDSPRVVVTNKEWGSLQLSTTKSYVSSNNTQVFVGRDTGFAAGGSQTSQLTSGRSFEVRPYVSSDRKFVTLSLSPQWVSNTSLTTFQSATGPLQLAQYDQTTISTIVTIPDGGWVLLGGLTQSGESEMDAGVPVLSKIPVLKRAFSNRSRVKDEKVQLLLVKPRIILMEEQEKAAFPDLATSETTSGGS